MPHRYDLYLFAHSEWKMRELGLSPTSIKLVLLSVDREATLVRELRRLK